MRRLLALLARVCTTAHGICVLLILAAAGVAVAPLALNNAAPFDIPATLDVPPVEARPHIDPERTSGYASAHAVRSYLYLEEIGRGRGSILWDPGEFGGTPFLAQWDTRALSPFTIPVYLFGAEAGLWIAAMLKIAVAGAVAFYAARVLGITHPFALYVALAHALSGVLVVWTADPVADVVVWAPMVFLFAERLSLGQLRYWPVAAIVIGLMCLGGMPQAVASTFAFFGVYFVYRRTHRNWSALTGPLFSALVAVVLGMSISAAQILPWSEWLVGSRAIWIAGDAPGLTAAGMPFGPLARATGLVDVRSASPLHVGYVPLLLSGLWLVVRPQTLEGHRRRVDALFIVSGIWLGGAILLALVQPFAKVLQPILLRALVAPVPFGLALGGAAAAEAWLQLRPAQSLEALRRFAIWLGIFVALAMISYSVSWPRIAGVRHAPMEIFAGAIAIVVFTLVLGITLVRPWPRLMGYPLCAVAALQLLVVFVPLQPRTAWADLGSRPFASASDVRNGRVAFGPGTDSAGRMALESRLMRGFGPRAPARVAGFLERAASDPLLFTRAGVSRFVLSLDDVTGPYSRLRPLLRLVSVTAEGAGLFEYVPGAQPTRLIHEIRVVSNFNAAQLDSSQPELVEAAADPGAVEGRLGKPLLASNNSVGEQRVNVYQNDPGVLVLGQTFYPDWSARVDGVPTRIFAVDGAFQGIELDSGSREAIFRYSPRTFRWGVAGSCVALSICLLGLAHLIFFRLRHQFFKM